MCWCSLEQKDYEFVMVFECQKRTPKIRMWEPYKPLAYTNGYKYFATLWLFVSIIEYDEQLNLPAVGKFVWLKVQSDGFNHLQKSDAI